MCPLRGTEILYDMGDRGGGATRVDELMSFFKSDGSFHIPSHILREKKYTKEEIRLACERYAGERKQAAEADDYTRVEGVEIRVHGKWEEILREKKSIRTPEDGFQVLSAYSLIVNELTFLAVNKKWEDVAALSLLFQKESISDRLPAEVRKFSDHDTRHLRMEINAILGDVTFACVDNSGVRPVSRKKKVEDLLINLRKNWELYSFIMSDILMRIEDKTKVPERFTDSEFLLSEVLEPVIDHIEKISKKGGNDGVRFVQNIDNRLSRKMLTGNKNTLGNILNNVLVNALGFSKGEVRLLLREENGRLVIGVFNNGGAIMEDKNGREVVGREGREKIYNEGYSSRGSTGLGLSHADTRLESLGASIVIVNDKKIAGQEYNGFEMNLPLKDK